MTPEEYVKKILLSNNVDIHTPNYKSIEKYLEIKDMRIIVNDECDISLEEFIEKYLLSEQEVMKTYDSIYEMGNPYKLTDNESTDIAVAYDILMEFPPEDIDNTDEYEIKNNFVRPGGLIDRINSYLKINLDSFEKKDLQYKRERCKILYLFYKLEHNPSLPKNILKLLSNPSMENIDTSFINKHTYNGNIIKNIKNSLEKELSLSQKGNIKRTIYKIVSTWDKILKNAQMLMDFFYIKNTEYNFEETIRILSADAKSQNTCHYTSYPIEMLYLEIIKLEYMGNVKDICHINKLEKKYTHNISPALIEEMKKLNDAPVDSKNIEQYIYENALRLSKYIYLGEKVQKEDVRRIRNAKEKLPIWLNFCTRANPSLDITTISNELQIVSFLQALLLDDPAETFKYTFYGYQKYFKHMEKVNAIFKNTKEPPNALQCYWIRKVADRWYANLGRLDERIALRKFEMTCDNILMEILNQPCLDEMYKMHKFFLERVDEALITTSEQIWAVTQLEKHLQANCYKYIDPLRIIRYAFLYPPEIDCTYCYLIEKIDAAIENHCSLIKERLTISTANGKGEMVFDLDIAFNHPNKQCILYDFNIISAQ